MRITEIAAVGLKGPGFRYTLAPMTYITGDNGSGKTAITDAIKIALLRRHPILGATNKAIMQLATGNQLEIECQLSNTTPGRFAPITMRWSRKKADGPIKSDHSDHPEHHELYDLIPEAVLDFAVFANAKPTERQRILEAAMAERVDATQLIADKIASMNRKAVEAIDCNWSDLQSFEQHCREARKLLVQEGKRLKGALEQSVVDEATMEMAERVIEAADIEAAYQDMAEALKASTQATNALEVCTEARMRAPDAPDQPKPTDAELKDIAKRIALAETVDQRRAEAARHNERIHTRIREIDKAIANSPESAYKPDRPRPTEDAMQAMQNDLREIEQEGAQAFQGIQAAERCADNLKAERDKLKDAGRCPMCGTAGQELDQAIEDLYGAKLAANKEALDDARKRHSSACNRQKAMETRLNELAALQASWDQWEAHKLRVELLTERTEQEEELEDMPEAADTAGLTRHQSQLFELLDQWTYYEARIKDVPLAEAEALLAEKAEEARETLKTTRERWEELKAEADKGAEARQRVKDQQRYSEELDLTTAAMTALDGAARWAKEESLKQTAEALRPILEPANAILHDVVTGELAIEGTQVGLRHLDSFRPLEVLSGAEQTATTAALQVALAGKSVVRTIIVDELSRLTWARREQLVVNLADAIGNDLIEQAILVDHDTENLTELAVDGDTVILCAREELA